MNLTNYPVLKLLLPYIMGIFLAYWGKIPSPSYSLIFVIILFNLFIANILYRYLSYLHQWITGIFILMAFFFVGLFQTSQKIDRTIPNFLVEKMAKNEQYVAQILEAPREKLKSFKLLVQIKSDSQGHSVAQKAVIYVKKDSASQQLSYGDVLLISTKLSPISGPENPYSFDNQTYLGRKGILLTGYVPDDAWQMLYHESPNVIMYYAQKLQHLFSDIFAQNGLQGDEYAIITAILLGNDETMEPELKAQYASAGVSHILCVSGMHVGIIFMILNFLLKPLGGSKQTRAIKAVLLLLCIWVYACITGLAPSVQRAASMFTFVTFGNLLNRNANIFHSLFASLFLLLLINPLLIFEIGFEMSYLAVFGIVILQKPIVSVYKPKTKIGNYFWELISVSTAAQLATFPLSIYYFGQFPNYFLLANMSVIMLSFVVVVTGVVILATSFVSVIAQFVGTILTYEIKLMNFLIQSIDSLPFSVTRNISYSMLQVVLCYACIASLFFYFHHKNKKFKYLTLSLFVIFIMSFGYDKYQSSRREDITAYSIEKMSAIGFNYHGNRILLVDTATTPHFYDFNIKNHERRARIVSTQVNMDTANYESQGFLKIDNCINYQGYTFYLLSGRQTMKPTDSRLSVDYLYMRHNPKISMKKLRQCIDFKQVIIDKSNSVFYDKKWTDSCKYYQIPYYSMRENGYFYLKCDKSKK